MKKGSELLVPLAVLVANASGVAVSLITPVFLPPAEYSEFALAWAVGQFLAVMFFEWLRFPALRFSAGPDRALAAARASVIAAAYRRTALGVAVLIALSMLFVRASGVLAILPLALLYGVTQGTFDGRQAFARAAHENLSFSRTWATRALLSVALVVAVGWTTRSGWATAIALSLSFPIALGISALIDRNDRADAPVPGIARTWSELPRLARYGILAAVSGVVANAMPTLIRWALVDQFGKGGAAGALLAADLAQKALSVTGLAVNVVAMQNSFRAVDTGDKETIHRSNQTQIAWAFLAVVPVGLLVYLMGPDIAKSLMRETYRPTFVAGVGACALAAGLICIRLFAADPIFYEFEKAGYSMVGAIVSLLLCVGGLTVPGMIGLSLPPLTVFWLSAAAGLVISAALVIVRLGVQPPWAQLARIASAAGTMVAISQILPRLDGMIGLAFKGMALGMAYVAVAIVTDVVGLRSDVLARMLRRER